MTKWWRSDARGLMRSEAKSRACLTLGLTRWPRRRFLWTAGSNCQLSRWSWCYTAILLDCTSYFMTKLYKTQEICQPYANLTSLFILFIVFIPYNCHNLTEMDPEAGGDGKARDPYAAQSCRACRVCRAWASGAGRGEIWCSQGSVLFQPGDGRKKLTWQSCVFSLGRSVWSWVAGFQSGWITRYVLHKTSVCTVWWCSNTARH